MAVKFENLVKVVPKAILDLLPAAFEKYDINGPLRASNFLGQIAHESGDFTIKTESLFYTHAERIIDVWPSRFNLDGSGGKKNANDYVKNEEKLAEAVYGGRMGNNNPGDGFRFRGGGFLQLTGKDAYKDYASYLEKSVEETADLLRSENFYSLDAALWEFSIVMKLNTVADTGVDDDTIKKITKRINGGYTGLDERKAKVKKYYGLLG
jgi:putative chitinase